MEKNQSFEKKFNKEELKNRLTEEQYRVTQEAATERPWGNKYYKTKTKGMYKCVVCGNELFSSDTKFDSFSGWPSFYDVSHSDAVKLIKDDSLGMSREEVVCAKCGAHLGHIFPDAPETPTGNRFCINSSSLDLEEKDTKNNEDT